MKKMKRMCTFMALIMLIAFMPTWIFATDSNDTSDSIQLSSETYGLNAPIEAGSDENVIISAFDELDENIAFGQGFGIREATPGSLILPVQLEGLDNENYPVTICDVTWECTKRYDNHTNSFVSAEYGFTPDIAGYYRFTPILPQGYELAYGLMLPEIQITISTLGGTDAKPMDSTIVWDSTSWAPNLTAADDGATITVKPGAGGRLIVPDGVNELTIVGESSDLSFADRSIDVTNTENVTLILRDLNLAAKMHETSLRYGFGNEVKALTLDCDNVSIIGGTGSGEVLGLRILGDLVVEGDLTVTGGKNVIGPGLTAIDVRGNLTVNGNLTATGGAGVNAFSSGRGVYIDGELTVNGSLAATGIYGIQSIGGDPITINQGASLNATGTSEGIRSYSVIYLAGELDATEGFGCNNVTFTDPDATVTIQQSTYSETGGLPINKNFADDDDYGFTSTAGVYLLGTPVNIASFRAAGTVSLAELFELTVSNGSGGGKYLEGDVVSITADPAPLGQVFDRWTAGDNIIFAADTSPSTTFTMPAEAVAVTATYKPAPPAVSYNIALNQSTGGVANINKTSAVAGESVTLGISSLNANYSFSGWTVSPSVTWTSGNSGMINATFTMPASNVTVIPNYVYIGGNNSYYDSGSDDSSYDNTANTYTPPQPRILGGSGWSNITDKADSLKTGNSLDIEMNGTTAIPGSFFNNIAGKDVEISFNMGNGLIWKVNGEKVPTDRQSELNLGITKGGAKLAALVENISGSKNYTQLNINHNGRLPFEMTLSMNVGRTNSNQIASLYYHNASTDTLEFRQATKIASDGTVELTFNRASVYAVIIEAPNNESLVEPEKKIQQWSNPFADISTGDWFYDDVKYVYESGLFNGVTNTEFGPQTQMTRGMVVTVLGRLAGIRATDYSGTSFDDVDTTQYYAPYIKWAAQMGIVNGTSSNAFAPNANISRQDLALMLNNFSDKMDVTMKQTRQIVVFTDSENISEYADSAVGNMVRAGVISGMADGSFAPVNNATRAEVATMLHRFSMATVK